RSDFDGLARLDGVRRDVYPLAVHQNVAVRDKLPRRPDRRGEARAVHQVVEPALQQAQQVLARRALLLDRLAEVAAHLPLAHVVDESQLLLLFELARIVTAATAAVLLLTPVLPRRVGALLDNALVLRARDEHLAEAALLFRFRSAIGHVVPFSSCCLHDHLGAIHKTTLSAYA